MRQTALGNFHTSRETLDLIQCVSNQFRPPSARLKRKSKLYPCLYYSVLNFAFQLNVRQYMLIAIFFSYMLVAMTVFFLSPISIGANRSIFIHTYYSHSCFPFRVCKSLTRLRCAALIYSPRYSHPIDLFASHRATTSILPSPEVPTRSHYKGWMCILQTRRNAYKYNHSNDINSVHSQQIHNLKHKNCDQYPSS